MTDEVTEEYIPPQDPIDLIETNGQINSKAYVYRVTPSYNSELKYKNPFFITAIAVNTTSARVGLTEHYKNCTLSYIGVSEQIVQVNDQTVVEV